MNVDCFFQLNYECKNKFISLHTLHKCIQGCHGRNHIVVGFTTTYAISAYNH